MTFIPGLPYSRQHIGLDLGDSRISTSREGIVFSGDKALLIVTLDKEKQPNKNLHYNDFFEGDLFHWDSQTTQSINTPQIQKIVNKVVSTLLFIRIHPKIKSKANAFIYCGNLRYKSHDQSTSRPVHIIFECLDFIEEPNAQLAKIYDWTPSADQPRTVNYETPIPKLIKVKRAGSSGQGYARDQATKLAVEMHAMGIAIDYYENAGYEVVDTSSNESFDLICAKDHEVLKVEVKGTTSPGQQVLVTANEVKEARLSGIPTDLFIVHSIQVRNAIASGGLINKISHWNPSDDSLIPTMFRHSIK